MEVIVDRIDCDVDFLYTRKIQHIKEKEQGVQYYE